MTHVLLQGGPAHGATVESKTGATMSVEGHGVPEGFVARYWPMDGRKRDNTVFRFCGLDKVVGRIPLPGVRA
jgi:hypothetical protein